jgi:IMP dehydrogenase
MTEDFYRDTIEMAWDSSRLALTFDDVTLRPRYSDVNPKKVDFSSRFSRNVPVKIPIVAAAMDTVTEHGLAIALAIEGGIGIIHKGRGMTPNRQAKEVSRTKHRLNFYIECPITVFEDETVRAVLNRRERKGYDFRRFLVLNRETGKLAGIVTGNDFDLCDSGSRKIRDIMTREENLLQLDSKCTIQEAYKYMTVNKKKALPIADKEGNVLGLYVFTDVHRVMNGSGYNIDSKGRLRVGAAIGVHNDAYKRLEKLVEQEVDVVVIDASHGDSKNVHDTLIQIKKLYPNLDVVVGNVCIPDAAKRLVDLGADGVKIGVGPGSICTTRVISGVGRPQVSSVYFCSKEIYGLGVPVCADGGASVSGDLTKAIAGGADTIMLGGMLAGTEEAPGDLIFNEGDSFKEYRGMGSLGAMRDSKGARQRYQENDIHKLVPQGIEARVRYKGPLRLVVEQYLGGLGDGMGLVGAKNIDELKKYGQFDRVTSAGIRESHPHDVEKTKEAPNYNPSRR